MHCSSQPAGLAHTSTLTALRPPAAEGESAEAAPAKKKAPAKKRPVAELQDEAVLGERPCPLPVGASVSL